MLWNKLKADSLAGKTEIRKLNELARVQARIGTIEPASRLGMN